MSPLFPLLALIARHDAYGYELKRIVETEFAPAWAIDFAQLYRSLASLRAQRFVRVRAIGRAGGPERKQYAITPRGQRALAEWLRDSSGTRAEVLLKTKLAAALDTPADLPLMLAGSDDPLFAYLAQTMHARSHVVGSTAGLLALAQQQAEIAGAHLRAPEADEYNVSFVQHLIGEQDILLINLAVREYGLLVARGNPKKIRQVRDLARRNVRVLNRPQGSGARTWLQRHLRAAHIDPMQVLGWANSVTTYDAIARALELGQADAGPGLRITAQQFGLEFVSMGQERFDLVMARALYESERGENFFTALHSSDFQNYARMLPGYDVSDMGRVIAQVKYGTPKIYRRKKR